MVDNPLSQSFGGTISSREELEELLEKVDAFAGTLVEEYERDVEIDFTVSPKLDVQQEDE